MVMSLIVTGIICLINCIVIALAAKYKPNAMTFLIKYIVSPLLIINVIIVMYLWFKVYF